MAASTTSFITGIIINLVVGIICFIIFSILRIMPFSKRFYGGKRYFGSPSPEPLSDSLWGWIWPIITYKEPKIIASAGLDTAIYLRVLTFGVELFFWVGLWALVSLLPINLTDDYVDVLMDTQAALANSTNSTNTTSTALYTFTDFDKVGLANVSSSSARMWMHVFSCYVTTLITLWLLFRYSKESVLLRIMFLANSIPGRSSHTVLVTDIPAIAGDTRRKKRDISMQRMSQSSSRGNKIAPSPSVDDAAALTPVERMDADNPTDNQPDAEAYGKPSKDNDANEPLMDDHPERDATAPEPQIEAPPSVLRQRRRYNYQLNYSESKKLDPYHQAEAALKEGMTPKGMVTAEFEHVYSSGAVANLEMVCNQAMLRPLVTEYDRRVQQLDDLVDMCAFRIEKGVSKKLKPPQVTLFMPLHGKWGRDTFGGGLFKKVDAFEFLTKRLQELEIRIQEEQPLSAQMNWPSAFVTFSTRLNQAVCSTSLHHHDTSTWLTQPAPEPYELIWQNLGMSTSMRGALTALMWVAFWVMTLFFMIPVGMVQAVIEVPRLSGYPVIGGFVSNPVITKLLQSIVPGLALKIFLLLVPPIIRLMLRVGGAVSENELDMGTVSRFFLFQVVVVFFGTVIMGSFFNQITQWIASPFSVISILGTSIPMVSTFFCSYILVNALMVNPISFLRVPGYVIFWLKSVLAGSPKARDRLWQEQYTLLGTTVVNHTIVILLGLVYSSINPIITLFALTYFCVNFLIERYQNIYVLRRNYESAGKLWAKIFNQVLVALYIKLITMLGLLGIKQFTGAPALIPLLFIVLIFHFVASKMFERPWQFMSMHDGADLDELDKECEELGGDEEERAAFERDAYLSPYFKVKPGQLDPLFAEAAAMRETLLKLNHEEGAEEAKVSPVPAPQSASPQPSPLGPPQQKEEEVPMPPPHNHQEEDQRVVI